MLKRILPFIILALVIGPTIAIVLLLKDKEISVYPSLSVDRVPLDAVWILETKTAGEFTNMVVQSDPLFPALEKFSGAKSVMEGLVRMDSIVHHRTEYRESLAKASLVTSLHQTGKDQFQLLFILEMPNQMKVQDLRRLFKDLTGNEGQWTDRTYNRSKIYRVGFGEEAVFNGISLTMDKKTVVMSSSPILVENAIRQAKDKHNLNENPSFRRIVQTSGLKVAGNLYVNLKMLPTWIGSWMNTELNEKLTAVDRFGDWTGLDITVRNDALMLNGIGLSGDSLNTYLDVFKHQTPQTLDIDHVIPASAGAFISLGIDKPEAYFQDLHEYLSGTEAGRRRGRLVELIKGATQENIESSLSSLISKDICLAYLGVSGSGKEEPVVIIGTHSRNQTNETLMGWLSLRADRERKDIASYRTIYSFDREKQFSIYQMGFAGLPEMAGGPLFSRVKGQYFGFVGNYLILADHVKAVQDVIYYFELNKTINTDPVYIASNPMISSRSSFTLYATPLKMMGLMEGSVRKDWVDRISKNENFFKELGAVCFQFHAKGDLFFQNVLLQFTQLNLDRPQTVWESRLSAPINCKPVFVTNHYTQAKEILVQDIDNNLYLINTAGRVLWKVPIEEQINSEIFQIDVLKNNKLQLLFSTDNYIHLIDRNGNYVSNYPIRLRSKATNGMAVFDYDRNKDYRFVIACADRKVYVYNKTGSIVKGWGFDQTEGTVTQPVSYFRIKNKDYLALADEMRVYILDRRGNVRIQPQQQFPVSRNNPLVLDGGSSNRGPCIVTTDGEGTVMKIYMDGKVEEVTLQKYGPNHRFILEDMNKDGKNDYIFVEDNRLDIYQFNREKILSKKLDGPIEHTPNIYLFPGNEKKIGVVVPSKNDIFLFNSDGSLYKGFPLRGSTPFTIGYLEPDASHFNLIVGSSDQFLYNYRIK